MIVPRESGLESNNCHTVESATKSEFSIHERIEVTSLCGEVMSRTIGTYANLEPESGSAARGEHLAALGPQCCAFRDGTYSLTSNTTRSFKHPKTERPVYLAGRQTKPDQSTIPFGNSDDSHPCLFGINYAEAIDLESEHNVHDNGTSHDTITSSSKEEKSFSTRLC